MKVHDFPVPNTDAAPKPDRRVSDETELLRRYAETRDPALKEELVHRFLPLARSLALRYRGSSEDIEDLIQVASLGLVKALDGFDLERGRRSSPTRRRRSWASFAATSATGSGRCACPEGSRSERWRSTRRRQSSATSSGQAPTVSQIAERLAWNDEEVSEALQADEARRTLSLEVPRSREDVGSATILETLGETEPGYDAVEAQLAAEEAPLDERERRVLRLRFEEDLNQYEIGRRLGVSQMQVSRIMRRALRKLLAAVQAKAVDEADARPPR